MEIQDIINKIKTKFEADEVVPAALFIESKTDKMRCGIMPLNFDGNYEKELARRMARAMIQRIQPDRYFFVAEAWASKNPNTRPSEAEDKIEIIHIVEYNRDMTIKVCTIPLNRDNDKAKLGPEEIMVKNNSVEISTDRWNFFLEES